MRRVWIIPLAALALVVPVGALALDGGSRGLDLQASLDSCGVAEDAVVCKIDASFNKVEDGEYYTAIVTRPDSTVQDFGSVATGSDGQGSAELFIPYAGNGEYVVEVTAWGYGSDGEIEEVATDSEKSESKGNDSKRSNKDKDKGGDGGDEQAPADSGGTGQGGSEQGEEPPAPAPLPVVLPECEPGEHGEGGDEPGSSTGEGTDSELPAPAPAPEPTVSDPATSTGDSGDPASEELLDPEATLRECEEPVKLEDGSFCCPDEDAGK